MAGSQQQSRGLEGPGDETRYLGPPIRGSGCHLGQWLLLIQGQLFLPHWFKGILVISAHGVN